MTVPTTRATNSVVDIAVSPFANRVSSGANGAPAASATMQYPILMSAGMSTRAAKPMINAGSTTKLVTRTRTASRQFFTNPARTCPMWTRMPSASAFAMTKSIPKAMMIVLTLLSFIRVSPAVT
jgi:hypothetical protein